MPGDDEDVGRTTTGPGSCTTFGMRLVAKKTDGRGLSEPPPFVKTEKGGGKFNPYLFYATFFMDAISFAAPIKAV